MGLYIYMTAVSSKTIDAAFGSHDKALLDKCASDGECFDDALKALSHIINAQDKTLETHHYGYALIELCFKLGQQLPYTQDIKLGFETDWINRVLDDEFCVSEPIEVLLLPCPDNHGFDIPAMEEFPIIGKLDQTWLQELQRLLSDISIDQAHISALQHSDNQDQAEQGYALAHIKGIIENINFCVANGLDLMVFCH